LPFGYVAENEATSGKEKRGRFPRFLEKISVFAIWLDVKTTHNSGERIMLQDFINKHTYASPGSTITLARLRQLYAAEYGRTNRSAFVAALASAGLKIAYHERTKQAVVVDRSFTKPAVAVEVNGVLCVA
jgi:hypothetical protein